MRQGWAQSNPDRDPKDLEMESSIGKKRMVSDGQGDPTSQVDKLHNGRAGKKREESLKKKRKKIPELKGSTYKMRRGCGYARK